MKCLELILELIGSGSFQYKTCPGAVLNSTAYSPESSKVTVLLCRKGVSSSAVMVKTYVNEHKYEVAEEIPRACV